MRPIALALTILLALPGCAAVIAGVLNLLVIYDALAGPMFRDDEEETPSPPAPAGGTKS